MSRSPWPDTATRLLVKTNRTPGGCWNWTGGTDPTGYGRFHLGPRNMGYAHRVAYELFVEAIPAGLDLDHLCRNRRCVNPAHLEPVTRSENLRRGDTLVRAHVQGVDCGHAECVSCRWKRGAA